MRLMGFRILLGYTVQTPRSFPIKTEATFPFVEGCVVSLIRTQSEKWMSAIY